MTERALGTTCAVHEHREMVPIEVHHIHPTGLGGPDIAANKVKLCANAHGSVHLYLDLLRKHNGVVPWSTGKRYGKRVRDLARQGYDAWRTSLLDG